MLDFKYQSDLLRRLMVTNMIKFQMGMITIVTAVWTVESMYNRMSSSVFDCSLNYGKGYRCFLKLFMLLLNIPPCDSLSLMIVLWFKTPYLYSYCVGGSVSMFQLRVGCKMFFCKSYHATLLNHRLVFCHSPTSTVSFYNTDWNKAETVEVNNRRTLPSLGSMYSTNAAHSLWLTFWSVMLPHCNTPRTNISSRLPGLLEFINSKTEDKSRTVRPFVRKEFTGEELSRCAR